MAGRMDTGKQSTDTGRQSSSSSSSFGSSYGSTTATMTSRGKSPTHEQIAARAKQIWSSKGCPTGQDAENWQEAENQLRAEQRQSR
jgi:hypothetical protein